MTKRLTGLASRRRTRIVVAVSVLAVAMSVGAYLAVAGGGIPFGQQGQSRVGAQAFATVGPGQDLGTSSAEFENVPGLAVELCGPASGVSADVSMELSGGPAQVRVVTHRKGRRVALKPSQVTFVPVSGGPSAGSFTFAREFARKLPPDYQVQWRSADGRGVTLSRGSLRVLYADQAQGCA